MQLRAVGFSQKNPCNGCTACCEIVAAPQLGKPTYTRCVHACAAGCAIYESRPSNCRTWLCLWAGGFLGNAYRPADCGLMFSLVPGNQGHVYLEVYEVCGGALENRDRLKYLLERLREKGLAWTRVLEIPYGTKLGISFHPDQEKYPGTELHYGHTCPTEQLAPNHYRVIPTEPKSPARRSAEVDSAATPNAGGPAD